MLAWLRVVCISLLVGASSQGNTADPVQRPNSGVIEVAPPSIDFGSQPVGSKSQPRTATLTNISPTTVSIRDITASGIDFSETDNCQSSLPAGAHCTIAATFTPAISGPRLGTIIITADPPGFIMLVLAGTGAGTSP